MDHNLLLVSVEDAKWQKSAGAPGEPYVHLSHAGQQDTSHAAQDSVWQITCALPYEPTQDLRLWVYDAAASDEAQTVGRAVLHIGQMLQDGIQHAAVPIAKAGVLQGHLRMSFAIQEQQPHAIAAAAETGADQAIAGYPSGLHSISSLDQESPFAAAVVQKQSLGGRLTRSLSRMLPRLSFSSRNSSADAVAAAAAAAAVAAEAEAAAQVSAKQPKKQGKVSKAASKAQQAEEQLSTVAPYSPLMARRSELQQQQQQQQQQQKQQQQAQQEQALKPQLEPSSPSAGQHHPLRHITSLSPIPERPRLPPPPMLLGGPTAGNAAAAARRAAVPQSHDRQQHRYGKGPAAVAGTDGSTQGADSAKQQPVSHALGKQLPTAHVRQRWAAAPGHVVKRAMSIELDEAGMPATVHTGYSSSASEDGMDESDKVYKEPANPECDISSDSDSCSQGTDESEGAGDDDSSVQAVPREHMAAAAAVPADQATAEEAALLAAIAQQRAAARADEAEVVARLAVQAAQERAEEARLLGVLAAMPQHHAIGTASCTPEFASPNASFASMSTMGDAPHGRSIPHPAAAHAADDRSHASHQDEWHNCSNDHSRSSSAQGAAGPGTTCPLPAQHGLSPAVPGLLANGAHSHTSSPQQGSHRAQALAAAAAAAAAPRSDSPVRTFQHGYPALEVPALGKAVKDSMAAIHDSVCSVTVRRAASPAAKQQAQVQVPVPAPARRTVYTVAPSFQQLRNKKLSGGYHSNGRQLDSFAADSPRDAWPSRAQMQAALVAAASLDVPWPGQQIKTQFHAAPVVKQVNIRPSAINAAGRHSYQALAARYQGQQVEVGSASTTVPWYQPLELPTWVSPYPPPLQQFPECRVAVAATAPPLRFGATCH